MALSQPPVTSLVEAAAAQSFRELGSQLQDALGSIETAREMVVGSFEVLMAQTAQRTNDVMRVLTVTSVALLPPSLVAALASTQWQLGVYGSRVAFAAFVVALASMVAVVVVVARRRHWL
jgi:Mg2+ and Co2+ transporter CorA